MNKQKIIVATVCISLGVIYFTICYDTYTHQDEVVYEEELYKNIISGSPTGGNGYNIVVSNEKAYPVFFALGTIQMIMGCRVIYEFRKNTGTNHKIVDIQ